MTYVARRLEGPLRKAAGGFPAVLVTGPRRAGKTELLRHAFPRATYCLLEDPDVLERVRADPRTFLAGLATPVILDEIQNAPELLSYVRTRIDTTRRRLGQWLLTGSQEPALMEGVAESLAGRAAILHLLPFSTGESAKVGWFRGGFPEVVTRPRHADLWFSSYVQTYLERDVRQVTAIRDLGTFRRFLGLVASRIGQVLNRTDLAAPLGVSVPTISQWLSILEVTNQILLVHPYFENFGKRLTKSPKIHFADPGLACHLLGLRTERELIRSPFAGPVFESFVASEIVKAQIHAGRRRELYTFRDRKGLEVDFVVPTGARRLAFVEAKSSRTPRIRDAESLLRLKQAAGDRPVEAFVVHGVRMGIPERRRCGRASGPSTCRPCWRGSRGRTRPTGRPSSSRPGPSPPASSSRRPSSRPPSSSPSPASCGPHCSAWRPRSAATKSSTGTRAIASSMSVEREVLEVLEAHAGLAHVELLARLLPLVLEPLAVLLVAVDAHQVERHVVLLGGEATRRAAAASGRSGSRPGRGGAGRTSRSCRTGRPPRSPWAAPG